ncbi:MAG: glyoxalase [Candidatus Dormibacteraeota bacterium]|nr:glyoxalase [Candidatus Dormibacteraeota bacterium]
MLRNRIIRLAGLIGVPIAAASAVLGLLAAAPAAQGQTRVAARLGAGSSASVAVGPQYDTTHIYVQPGTAAAFVTSWEATFGGTNTTPVLTDVTPTPSQTLSELVLSPVGTLSVFDYKTGIPYPFGQERGGDLVSSFSQGVADATRSGAYLVVSPWNDPLGKDAIVQFPGGVDTQIYWHTTPPSYAPLATIPESRVYLEPQAAAAFIRDYLAFSHGRITLDDPYADGGQIGLPGTTFREVLISSTFGKTLVIVTDGHLPYPFGRETTGYAVTDLAATLAKAKAAGAQVLWGPYDSPAIDTAIVQFPGGFIAEIHQGGA